MPLFLARKDLNRSRYAHVAPRETLPRHNHKYTSPPHTSQAVETDSTINHTHSATVVPSDQLDRKHIYTQHRHAESSLTTQSSQTTTASVDIHTMDHTMDQQQTSHWQQTDDNHASKQIHYSNTFSMSKSVSAEETQSDDISSGPDNIIYQDINDLNRGSITKVNQITNSNYSNCSHNLNPNNNISNSNATDNNNVNKANILAGIGDLYATIDRKAKLKSRESLQNANSSNDDRRQQQYSNEYIDKSNRNYQNYQERTFSTAYPNDSIPSRDPMPPPPLYARHSCAGLLSGRTTGKDLRNYDLAAIDSIESYDSHQYATTHHRSLNNLSSKVDTSNAMKKNSSEKLEYELSHSNIYSSVQYKAVDGGNGQHSTTLPRHFQYTDERDDTENIFMDKDPWLRSSSCKDIYDVVECKETSGIDTYTPHPPESFDRGFMAFNRIDSPITRYDDSQRSAYTLKRQPSDSKEEFGVPFSKIYSSSYPGTTYNTLDQFHRRSSHGNRASDDELSHDSYELLEKSDIDDEDERLYNEMVYNAQKRHSYQCETALAYEKAQQMKRPTHFYHQRSCSLDSGNYIPTDDDESVGSDIATNIQQGDAYALFQHYAQSNYHTSYAPGKYSNRHVFEDEKSKSAADLLNDNEFFLLEDARYLPREKLCVKSDGNFYKQIKEAMRASSQDSKNEYYFEDENDEYNKHSLKSSDSSKKSRDSVYHTDSKKSRETSKSKTSLVGSGSGGFNTSSRASSQDSKESLDDGNIINLTCGMASSKNYEMPKTTSKKIQQFTNRRMSSERTSSVESKSEYYIAVEDDIHDDTQHLSHENLLKELASSKHMYDNEVTYSSTFPSSNKSNYNLNAKRNSTASASTPTSHVHSISLQNVETDPNVRTKLANTPTSASKCQNEKSIGAVISEQQQKLSRELSEEFRRSSADNIFSFDKDKIQSLTGSVESPPPPQSTMKLATNSHGERSRKSPDYPLTPELMSEFDKQVIESPHLICNTKSSRLEELIAKTHFEEYNPRADGNASKATSSLYHSHATVERTKSDPNSLANRSRLMSNARRHVLMHQKSIDLTPADTSDEEYFYKQIPSAPPVVCKANFKGMFNANQPYDMPNTDVAKSFLRHCEKQRLPLLKDDIPYILHKRNVMNGTAPSPKQKVKSPKSPISPKSPKGGKEKKSVDSEKKIAGPDLLENLTNDDKSGGFLFTQNIDLSAVDPVTLEIDKKISPTVAPLSPKRDITKRMDPKMMETLNHKLSQIESDTSSKTDSLQRIRGSNGGGAVSKMKIDTQKNDASDVKLIGIKKEITQATTIKRIIKSRVGKGKGSRGTGPRRNKIRITSFSSDDESINSDEVFGSNEAVPSRLEFSPPQSRKEIEPILRIEHSKIMSAAWCRGQTTMSSTEVEGSPPQTRRLAELESRYHTHPNDPAYVGQKELRRISERSISIPSSEDDAMPQPKNLDEISSQGYHFTEKIPSPILESCEFLNRTDDDAYETCQETKVTSDVEYTLITAKEVRATTKKSRTKLIEEFIDSSIVVRSKGHAPVLFAHARLNLSEGSAFASLQRQIATQDSPTAGRRAKSLDTPVISLNKLPPMNAFSTKDDTVDEEGEILEEKPLTPKHGTNLTDNKCKKILSKNDVNIDNEEKELLNNLSFIKKITLQGVKIKEKKKSKMKLRSGDHLILDIPKYKFDQSPYSSGNSSNRTSPGVSRASSVDSTGKTGLKKHSSKKSTLKSAKEKLLLPQNPHKSRAHGADSSKRSNSKERSTSTEKELPVRRLSKEKSRSQEESELDVARRKERQQKLYESAVKQTIPTLLSPDKTALPAFPAPPEDKILVTTDGDNIIIDTEILSKAKDHVLITKSPKKLDSSLVKFSRSFDENRSQEKIEKANRSFEDRNKSVDDSSDRSDNADNAGSRALAKQKIEGTVVHKRIDEKSLSLEKAKIASPPPQFLDVEIKTRSLDRTFDLIDSIAPESDTNVQQKGSAGSKVKKQTKPADPTPIEELDMQAVITERRKLDLLKRQSLPSTEDKATNKEMTQQTDEKLDCGNSEEESLTWVSEIKPDAEECVGDDDAVVPQWHHRIPTIECEEPSIEEEPDYAEVAEIAADEKPVPPIRVQSKLSYERSRSDESGSSWVTIECEEFIGTDISDNTPTNIPIHGTIKQSTLEDVNNDDLLLASGGSGNVTPTPENTATKQSQPDVTLVIAEKRSFSTQSTDRSRSTDTSSFDKDFRSKDPVTGNLQLNRASLDDESSVSCSISRPLGISQPITATDETKCTELRENMLLKLKQGNKPAEIHTKSPSLEKQTSIDLGCSLEQDAIEERISKLLARSSSDSSGSSEANGKKLAKKDAGPEQEIASVHKKLHRLDEKGECCSKKLNAPSNQSQLKGSDSDNRSSLESKSSAESKGSLSVESKSSFETESSSGSLGLAHRHGVLQQKEQQSTFKAFTVESSGSSSLDEWIALEDDQGRSNSNEQNKKVDDQKESDSSIQDELVEASSRFGMDTGEALPYNANFTLSRTLSRISERSTASESCEEEVRSGEISQNEAESIREECSIVSSDHQASISSDSRSITNFAYISDGDRRTSAEMPDIPCDSQLSERLADIYDIDDTSAVKTGRFCITNVEDGAGRACASKRGILNASNVQTAIEKRTLECLSNAGSQDSEEPLPDIPYDDSMPLQQDLSIETHIRTVDQPILQRTLPKSFCWKTSTSIQSQDSENWPSPPDSAELAITPVVEEVSTFYIDAPESASQVMVESTTDTTVTPTTTALPNESDIDEDVSQATDISKDNSQTENKFTETPIISPIIEQTKSSAHAIKSVPQMTEHKCHYIDPYEPKSCLSTASCLRSANTCCKVHKQSSNLMKEQADGNNVIMTQPTRTSPPQSEVMLGFDDEPFVVDEVFSPGTVHTPPSTDDSKFAEYFNRKISRGSNNSDTSNDDILSTTFDRDDITVRRRSSNLDTVDHGTKSSSSSNKKCSHSSHSEEETSSFGTDLDGTVRMGKPKKCTHSSHSEDTSIGLSISEWSTGTNTVRQYANLSGSDSLSAVSNHSGGIKSESKSKSSLSSLNKSIESLDEKSVGSFSSSKLKRAISGSSNGNDPIKYEQFFSSSDTDKLTESISGTPKSDDTTMTLTEIAQSITEWSTSSSKTLVATISQLDSTKVPSTSDSNSSTLKSNGDSIRTFTTKPEFSTVDYIQLKQNRSGPAAPKDDRVLNRKSTERPVKIPPPRVVDMQEKQPQFMGTFEESSPIPSSGKRRSLELMSKRYQSQDVVSESDQFVEKLYGEKDKLTERYQSQQFSQPHTSRVYTNLGSIDEIDDGKPADEQGEHVSPFDKPLIKHHSYDDKTLSKSQIRQYKTSAKVRQSNSFHEHMLTVPPNQSECSQIIEELTEGQSSSQLSGETSTENSSPMPSRPDKLVKCSPYYSSSLSSESPPIQVIQKPPRKTSLTRLKCPSSGNETDSSVDFRQQDSKLRTRGARKKRQVTNMKRMKEPASPVIEQESSAESSDLSKEQTYSHEYYDEEEEEEEVDEQKSGPYPSTSKSTKFESLDMSHDLVDEMGFPKYDRLSQYKPQIAPKPKIGQGSGSQPPEKPARQKKHIKHESFECKTSIRTQSYSQHDEPKSETQSSFSDNIYYSSEESSCQLSSTAAKSVVRRNNDSIQYETLENIPDCGSDQECSEFFDPKDVPPPMLEESDMSDEQ